MILSGLKDEVPNANHKAIRTQRKNGHKLPDISQVKVFFETLVEESQFLILNQENNERNLEQQIFSKKHNLGVR